MFVVEDDPNAKKSAAAKSGRAYAGSKTSRFDYPDLTNASSSSPSYPSTTHSDTNKYEPASNYSAYGSVTPKSSAAAESNKPKSRFRKYTGAKTSYGDAGGSSYTSSNPSGRYDRYKQQESNRYPAPKYDFTSSNSTKYGSGTTNYASGASSRYGAGGYNPHDTSKYNSGSAGYSSGYKPAQSGTYYQPVSSRPYNSSNYRPQPQFADVKPTIVDTRSQAASDTYQSKAQISLRQKEDTPEHSVSASIEQKATKYGGKYETSDGKIYYGGKPNKYSSKKSKRYNQRRKTTHSEQPQEKSDRPSV